MSLMENKDDIWIELKKLRAAYDDLRREIAKITNKKNDATQTSRRGALTTSGVTAEGILKHIYRREGKENGGKPADKLMLDELISELSERAKPSLLPHHIIPHLRTVQAWRNIGGHDKGDFNDVDDDTLIAVNIALNTVITWFFKSYFGGEFSELGDNNELSGDIDSTQPEITENEKIWLEYYWYASRNPTIKSIEKSYLDSLQSKYKISSDRIIEFKSGFNRNIEEFTEIINQALEDGLIEKEEAEAIEHSRTSYCISITEAKSILNSAINNLEINLTLKLSIDIEWIKSINNQENIFMPDSKMSRIEIDKNLVNDKIIKNSIMDINSDTIESCIDHVTIGNQIWMSKNLNIDRFRNGDLIPEARNKSEWIDACKSREPAWCYYEKNPENGIFFGKLYNYFAFMDRRSLAPEGWYIPNADDWKDLISFSGGEFDAVVKLQSTEIWTSKFKTQNNLGFSGLPGGLREGSGQFKSLLSLGAWWAYLPLKNQDSGERHKGWVLGKDLSGEERFYEKNFPESTGLSVRCLKRVVKNDYSKNHGEDLVTESSDKLLTITSPMHGTFYRSGGPDRLSYVNIGDEVKIGQTVCIVEAMMLFNEIESDIMGRVVEIFVDDGSPVELDQDLFLVNIDPKRFNE